jgi:NAD(P)-dependent dehydrogenase (short-subunit alcohol dehydrogenase family)
MSKSAANTIVITGATSGIGLGLAKAFLKEGYNVVGTGRSAERLQSAAAQLNAGDRFLGVAGDVGKPGSAKKAFDQAIAKYGKVDVLVNNAGIFAVKPFIQFTPDEIEEQIATNLKGMLYASQAAANHMIERKAGKIINITAALAMQPHSNVPALLAVALKGGINASTTRHARSRSNWHRTGSPPMPSHQELSTRRCTRRSRTVSSVNSRRSSALPM